MNTVNKVKESTLEKNMGGCAFIVFIIIVFFLSIGSCGDEDEIVWEPEKILTPEEQRTKDIEDCFKWDGSHTQLTQLIKSLMNDPDSYKHVKTLYGDQDSVILVTTTYRGKNAYGGVVTETISALAHPADCYVIEIIE